MARMRTDALLAGLCDAWRGGRLEEAAALLAELEAVRLDWTDMEALDLASECAAVGRYGDAADHLAEVLARRGVSGRAAPRRRTASPDP